MQLTVKVNTGEETFSALSWSPKGDVFTALFYDTCKIYNSGTGNVEQTIQNPCEFSHPSIAWSVDGTTLCLPMSDSLYFYEVATGKELRRVHFDGNGSEPQTLVYSPDGRFLAVGDCSCGVSIFKPSTAAFECTRLAKIRAAESSNDFIKANFRAGFSLCLHDAETGEISTTMDLPGPGWAALILSKDQESAYLANFFTGLLGKFNLSSGEMIASAETNVERSLAGVAEY